MKTKEGVCNASQLSVKRIILSIFFLLVLCRTAGAQDARKGILSAADAGTCTANSTACSFLTIPSGSGGVTFTITTNASGNTIQFEATGDTEPTGSHTWVALNVVPSNGTTAVTSTTSTGTWQANIAGFTQVRLRCSTFVGGTTTTYINLSTASARSNGGGGSVTHTAGNLTAFHLMLGNGLADSTVDSACVTNGTGALSGCTSIATTGSISTGSGASSAGTNGGMACVEATNAGWTPTAGQAYIRCDTTLNNYAVSIPLNGATETPLSVFSAVPAGGKCVQTSGVAGLIAETANPCGTATVLATGTNPPACAVATSAWCGGESVSPTLVAQVDDIHPDITNHCEDVANGLAENGCIVGSSQTIVTIGSGADIAATSLCSTVNCPVGTYRVNVYIDMSTPCGTTGTFIAWLGYTDDSGARTGSSTTTFFDIQGTGSVPSTGTLTTTSTANFGQATYILRTTGVATGGLGSINYGATRTACGTAGPMVGKMYLNVERIGFL